jgi:hypothetical protein
VKKEEIMGKLRSGILGHLSGKVAGVVGSRWKDQSTLREYVVPANPNTGPQQIQRGLMRGAVGFCKALVGQVFNVYVDKFQKSMSGFNYFISQNIANMGAEDPFPLMRLTWGKLWGITPLAAVKTGTSVTISWSPTSLGNNGKSTDGVYAAILDGSTGIWYFPELEVERSVSNIGITVPTGATPAFLQAYIWAAQYSPTSPTLLEMVSNSTFTVVTGT